MTESEQTELEGRNRPVIVLGVDTPIGVAILRDLGRHGYKTIAIGRSERSIGFASRYCDHRVVRANSEEALIEQLLALGEQFDRPPLIAISEHDHLLLNRHRERLAPAVKLLGARQDILDRVLDKGRCNQLASAAGLRVPHTFCPGSLTEAEQAAPGLSYPRVIKWADPNKVVRALEREGLPVEKYQYARNAEQLMALLRPYSAIGEFPLVQEYCPGGGIGQMFLVHDGEILLQFQHERIHEWPPEGGVSSLCRGVPLSRHEACREKSRALLRALDWEGVAMVEYRYDPAQDEYYFMEINGRFWGSLPLATASGVPFATALVRASEGQTLPAQQPYPILSCRFMIPEVRRLVRLLFQAGRIQDPFFHFSRWRELVTFFAAFLQPGMRYYIFEAADSGPCLADLKNILAKAAFWRR